MRLASLTLLLSLAVASSAQTMSTAPPTAPTQKWPTKDNVYVIKNFKFGTGESLPELTLHYLTLGSPHRNAAGHVDNAILLLHGTGGDRHTLLNPVFSNVLFGPGQPFDITKYFLILPDDIGQGDSSKPSDGLHMKFPQYDYDDMVRSQYIMLTEGMHVDHLRLILGTSMGCMQSWVWGETYPTFMDGLAPFACYPTELAGRNRMTRYIAITSIENDPAWKGGDYTAQPAEGLRGAAAMLLVMGSAPLQMQKNYPTRVQAEKYVDDYMARTIAHTDANNLIYYVNASRNYNPEPKLSTIVAPALWINSADDFINPPELGEKIINDRVLPKMPKTKFILIPISDATRGHGTHTVAAIWKQYLIDFMAETEPK
jgi:homoserine O-acetyltransferase/O-succinyltransferase